MWRTAFGLSGLLVCALAQASSASAVDDRRFQPQVTNAAQASCKLSEGVVRGRDFLHPELRLGFTVPAGFRIENHPSVVAIKGPDGTGTLTATRFTGRLIDHVLRYDDKWETTVNGISAAVGYDPDPHDDPDLSMYSKLVAFKWDKQTVLRLSFITGDGMDPGLNIFSSVRRLSEREASEVRCPG